MTDSSTDYFLFHRKLLQEFADRLPAELSKLVQDEQKKELLENLEKACAELDQDPVDGRYLMQGWLFSFIGNHPQLTPLVPRDLLWFLGGDCLHFMSDEEISSYQKIEDRLAESPGINWAEARRKVLHH